ncbi:MAGUK p55 subfamily member 5 [Hypsibius exemplaris]|uniref:MAGUK p55 subfamily member 5 n=1 Tax=Hypsibius exemplaris TaxID=2072580 RepID=A0A1W0X6Q1_HYPEX|nr:MAGUK p55 subfamily member 5 [Hypsibius exemplaris]
MNMTRKAVAVGKPNRLLSGYCVVVAENNEGKIKLFGSPADKASVEAGDEILEVNGKKLDESSHDDVINHIHQSIKSRRVSLKVRRRKGKKLAEEFPTYSIQNAYIVSSDDRQQSAHQNADLIHLQNGPNIIPVSMSSILAAAEPRLDEEIDIPDAQLDIGISLKQQSPVLSLSKPPSPIQESIKGETDESIQPEDAVEFIRPLSVPEQHRSIEDLLQRTLRNIDTCIVYNAAQGVQLPSKKPEIARSPKQLRDFSSNFEKFHSLPYQRPADFLPARLASEETSRIASSMPSSDSAADFNMATTTTQIQFNSNREMAIDVPEQFTGTVRRPLRHPNANSDSDGSGDVYNAAAWQEREKIRRYTEDIRKRTEEEQLKAKKEEFLRASLRNSTRLKALEKNAKPLPPPGFYNAAFEHDHVVGGGSGHDDFPVVRDDPAGTAEVIDVPDSQSMRQALDQIAAMLRSSAADGGGGATAEFANELDFIESLFESTAFRDAADLHHLIESRQIHLTEPVSTQAELLVRQLLPEGGKTSDRDARELHAILTTPEFKNLLWAHDTLATQTIELAELQPQKNGSASFHSDAPTIPVTADEQQQSSSFNQSSGRSATQALPAAEEESYSPPNYPGMDVRTIRIEKHGDTPLGATIRIDDDNGSVVVARIVHGGAAQKSGLLHEGDELIEVNGIDLRGRSLDEVCELLGRMVGTLSFTVLPAQLYSDTPPRRNDLHVRANFSYDPDDDPHVEALQCPCAGLGLSFQKRDILHIRNQDDTCWWQAYRDGEELGSVLAGLIPSAEHEQRRHDHHVLTRGDSGPRINGKSGKRDGKKRLGSKKNDKFGKKKRVVNGSPFDLDVGEVPWYEEVGLLNPKPYQKRPIVLIGPAQMGRKELLERLIASDPDRFSKPIAHTTRTKKPGDIDGRDYHFVSKHVFDGEILKQRFVEYGLFEKQLYGTSIEAVNAVIKSGKVCLLVVEPSAIRSLRAANFKPYVVFIAPPSLDKLQQNRLRMGVPADEISARKVIEEAQDMEDMYGHYIDLVIENVDESSTFAQLLTEINRLERDAQWVPADWLR